MLSQMLNLQKGKKVVGRASFKLHREMKLKDKLPTMSEDEQLQLLATNGMLVKRPLVIGDKAILVGFKENEWSEKLE